jgi:hypothetical protein
MKNLLKETGLRDINNLAKRYPKSEIYFHQDLDGVTTAVAMKKYLEDNGIDVVGAHIIQYGDKEFSVKKNDAQGDVMPVLVDFAHGKPMFVIHTDHHDKQVGVEKNTSTQFRGARSNVETISQVVSPKDLFPSSDILLINTVDSADYAKYNITPDEVVNYIYRLDKEKSLQQNKMLLGLVINKLLLAFKNKPGFLEGLVMDSEPSLMSILNNIKNWMKKTNAANPEELQKNAEGYKDNMKNFPRVSDSIIFQYGGGSMFKPGSYDRYTPLSKWEGQLKQRTIPLSTIKWVSETSVGPESIGFTFNDFEALYGDKFTTMEGGEKVLDHIQNMMETSFKDLTEEHKDMLDKIGINAWDLIQSNSGGHKCITNISGLNYLGRGKRPPQGQYKYDSEKDDSPSVKFTKMIANEFERKLKEKIAESK